MGLAGEDSGALFFVEFPPSSDGEIAERKGSNAFAHESQTGVSDGGGHATNLAVLALAEFKTEPGIDNGLTNANRRIAFGEAGVLFENLCAAGQAAVAFDDEFPAAEFGHGRIGGLPFDKNEVPAAMLELGMKEAVFECLLVGEEKQAFRVHVQSSQRENLWREVEFLEGAMLLVARVRVELTEDTVGLVKGDEHGVGATLS